MEQPRLFVYGTLRRGSPNQYADLLQANAQYVGNARMRGRLHQIGSYPGAVPSDQPGEWVSGELYHLEDPTILATLDDYEGSEFERILTKVSLDDGRELETWVYVFRGKTQAFQ
jgi:gamma-glutamylcyclotransferase (GGCT)/AIG2-like uncharacterized protein YtfP